MDQPKSDLKIEVQEVDPEARAQMKEYVERWKRVGPLLEAQREEDVRRADTGRAILSLTNAFLDARQNWPAGPTSGLVEQQRLFMLARAR